MPIKQGVCEIVVDCARIRALPILEVDDIVLKLRQKDFVVIVYTFSEYKEQHILAV